MVHTLHMERLLYLTQLGHRAPSMYKCIRITPACWAPLPETAAGGLEWAQESAFLTIPRDAMLLGGTTVGGPWPNMQQCSVRFRYWLLQAHPGFLKPVWRPDFRDKQSSLDETQLGASRLQPFWMSQPGGLERLGPWCSAGAHREVQKYFWGKKNTLRRKIRQRLDSFRVKQ